VSPEDAVLAAAGAALDHGDIVTDRDILESYRFDRSMGSAAGQPFAVVFPRSTEQVSEVMRACRENHIRTNWFKLLSKYPFKVLELRRR